VQIPETVIHPATYTLADVKNLISRPTARRTPYHFPTIASVKACPRNVAERPVAQRVPKKRKGASVLLPDAPDFETVVYVSCLTA
jgi:hypothetical protein